MISGRCANNHDARKTHLYFSALKQVFDAVLQLDPKISCFVSSWGWCYHAGDPRMTFKHLFRFLDP